MTRAMSDERLALARQHPRRLVQELVAEVDRLRAPAQLGSALVDALRDVKEIRVGRELRIDRDGDVTLSDRYADPDEDITTDATRALASLLAAFPQEDSRG